MKQNETFDEQERLYSAPALEKGLDILECLAASDEPMTTRALADNLGRSKNEIFRMVHVLVRRGYLTRMPGSEGLRLSGKLFGLGMRTPDSRALVPAAIPEMESFSEATGLSANLVVLHSGETVVAAATAGKSNAGITLGLGYGKKALEARSGLAILAFQTGAVGERLLREALAAVGGTMPADAEEQLATIRQQGSLVVASRDILGVNDVICPVLDARGTALASLLVPCLTLRTNPIDLEAVRAALIRTCDAVREKLMAST
jgi:DNA-binding IclR family transcriptional regulator